MYAPVRQIGEEISEAGEYLGRINAAHLKAQDLGKVTAAKGALNEQLGLLYNQITTDASIDPGTYREQFNLGRQAIVDEVGKALPSRLTGQWQGAAAGVSGDLAVKIDFEGKKKALDQAGQAFDQVGAQLLAQQSAEPDPVRHEAIGQELNTLVSQYVDHGIFSQTQAVDHMQKLRYTQLDNQIRLDPDGMVAMLEQGPAAVPGINPESFAKLLDTGRRVQENQLEAVEKREAKVDRDTKKAQEVTEAEVFGRMRQTSMADLNQLRDSRAISPNGYETMVRYKETQRREEAAEGRARAAEGRARAAEGRAQEERRNANEDAKLGIQAAMGNMTKEEIVNYAQANKLGPRAIDGAVNTAVAREKAELNSTWNQAEGRLKSAFFKGPFDLLPDAKAHALRNATEELERRSINFTSTYGGKEDPLKVVDEIIPKYMSSVAADTTSKLDSLRQRLLFDDPTQPMDLENSAKQLEGRRGELPGVMYEEQRRLLQEINELKKATQAAASATNDRETRSLWERIWGKGKTPAGSTP
jgi:hypothetical protein